MGAVLALVLLALLLASALRNPTRVLGESGRARRELVEAESALERGKALLAENPGADLSTVGLVSSTPTDTCVRFVVSRAGRLAIEETWSVTAAWSHVLFAGTILLPFGDVRLEGSVHQGIAAPMCLPDVVDPAAAARGVTRRIVTNRLADQTVANEVLLVSPADSSTWIVLENLRISHGAVLVEGDARIVGTFEGTAKEDQPLLLVAGDLRGEDHADTWTWKGVVASTGVAWIEGPIEYDGSLVSSGATLSGTVRGKITNPAPVAGVTTRIRVLGRRER